MFIQLNQISHVENPDVVRNILVKREASIKFCKGNTGNGDCRQDERCNVHYHIKQSLSSLLNIQN